MESTGLAGGPRAAASAGGNTRPNSGGLIPNTMSFRGKSTTMIKVGKKREKKVMRKMKLNPEPLLQPCPMTGPARFAAQARKISKRNSG